MPENHQKRDTTTVRTTLRYDADTCNSVELAASTISTTVSEQLLTECYT